jgi:hypothetical protein
MLLATRNRDQASQVSGYGSPYSVVFVNAHLSAGIRGCSKSTCRDACSCKLTYRSFCGLTTRLQTSHGVQTWQARYDGNSRGFALGADLDSVKKGRICLTCSVERICKIYL